MAQEQSIEAARTRIQRLVDEIATLSKKEMRSEDYFGQFLSRVIQACDAKGGAVWLVGKSAVEGKHEFQLAAQVEFESSLFQTDEEQRSHLLRALSEVVETKRPVVFAPAHSQRDPASLEAQLQQMQGGGGSNKGNKTPYPFLQVPLFLKEQILGVLQVWLQPYVTPENFQEFATFLSSLATQVEQHLQSKRLGTLVLETQRLQHLLKFSSDLAGSLDPQEVARLAANYGRDLIGCERCSIAMLEGEHWEVLAISGQETVEKKSSMIKAMVGFIEAHSRPEMVLLSKKELLSRAEALQNASSVAVSSAPPPNTEQVDLAYFELSHVVSASLAPMLNSDKELIGIFFSESTVEGFFETSPGSKDFPASTRVADWIATHTSRSLISARSYDSLPLLGLTRRLLAGKLLLTGSKRNRFLFKLSLLIAILSGIFFYPKLDRIDGNCTLMPVRRSALVSEISGRVEKIFVREGDAVKKGQPIAQLDTARIETELATNEQEKLRLLAESERYRGLGDEASARVTSLQAQVMEQNEKKLRIDLEAATLRSPIDGIVLTKDLDLHGGEFIQPGANFAEIAALEQWELIIDIDEKEIGRLERAMPKGPQDPPKDVSFILYSQSAQTLYAKLERHQQISSAAFTREKENTVFAVTLQNVLIPKEIQNAMRPGLTGRAKIDLGRRPLIWIWGSRILNWFHLRMIG